MADTTETAPEAPHLRSGIHSSEFWLMVASQIVSAVIAAGVITPASPLAQIVALSASVLSALGYTVARSQVKAASAAASK